MAQVMKGNKQLTINEDKVREFLELGYSLIDKEGNIVKAGMATSLKEIKEENATIKSEINKLKLENEKLKIENDTLKKQLEITTKKGK